MKYFLIILLLIANCWAQTKAPAKSAHKPTVAERLDNLESNLHQTTQANDDLKAENDKLKAANKELSDSNIALAAKYEELRKAAVDVGQYWLKASNEYQNAVAANSQLADKYNTLLNQANSIITQQNARLNQQARVNNALAIYGMMPRYTYVPLPQPVIPQSLNCTSTASGNMTFTNCH